VKVKENIHNLGELSTKLHIKRTLPFFILIFINSFVYADDLNPAFDKDVERFSYDLRSSNKDAVDEALIQLRWAGITDRRIFDPLVEKIIAHKTSEKTLKKYVQAISYSGNPIYLEALQKLSQDSSLPGYIRSEAAVGIRVFNKYKSISEAMSVGTEKANTNNELWAIRQNTALHTNDHERVRWAARDLYLHVYGTENLNVARDFIMENIDSNISDEYVVDAIAFLCKALGLSRNIEYKDVLIKLANNTPNKKLADYAERSVQYFDRNFKASNKHLMAKTKAKH
jgi:hypothetical protein